MFCQIVSHCIFLPCLFLLNNFPGCSNFITGFRNADLISLMKRDVIPIFSLTLVQMWHDRNKKNCLRLHNYCIWSISS